MKTLILDIDGVMTTGRFLYNVENGKYIKEFGADDNDGLSLVKPYLNIHFVTGDKKGFDISKKRVNEHMGYPIDLVSTTQRVNWIKENYDPATTIYIGDGIFDHYVFKGVAYSIAMAGALDHVKERADYITKKDGAHRGVAEACLHILDKFFTPYDPDAPLSTDVSYSGQWHA